MATGSDFLGSLLKGVASGARTFGAETMRQQDKKQAEEKEAQKIRQQYDSQLRFFETLAQNDEKYKHHLDFLKEFGQPLSNGQMKTLDEMYGKEQAGADLLYNELMGTQGANWSPVAADAGVVPGMLGTPTGQAESASKMLDYGAFRDEQGELIAPFKRDADISGMVEQRRAEMARKRNLEQYREKKTIDQEVKRDFEPAVDPVNDAIEKGKLAGVTAEAKHNYLKSKGLTDKSTLSDSDVNNIARQTRQTIIAQALKTFQEIRDNAEEYGVDDGALREEVGDITSATDIRNVIKWLGEEWGSVFSQYLENYNNVGTKEWSDSVKTDGGIPAQKPVDNTKQRVVELSNKNVTDLTEEELEFLEKNADLLDE